MPAIELSEVSKSFYLSSGQAILRHRLKGLLRRGHQERFHALRGISFRLRDGETMGVVGHNGAGKSTLLSLVAGLAWPDSGRISVEGRIAALLELGSGFHPDLTGSENVLMNGALLGLSRRRMKKVFDEVVDFAELRDFINEPLRTYSTGMVMRLAFSTAIMADPDILVIDEVLAVGDQNFQQKCRRKIMEFRHAGKMLLCVSHATQSLEGLCERAIWLDHGRMVLEGELREVVGAYQNSRDPGS